MRSSGILALAMLLCAQLSSAQDRRGEMLMQALQRVQNRLEQAPDRAVSVDLDVSTVSSVKEACRTQHLHQSSGAGRVYIKGDDFRSFEDRQARVFVMDAEKVVYVYDQLPDRSEPSLDQWLKSSRELLTKGSISLFQKKLVEGDSILTVEISLQPKVDHSQLQRVHVDVDLTKGLLRSVILTYSADATIRSLRYDYRNYTMGVLDPLLQSGALAQVYQNGRPLPRYRDHRFVDLRQSTIRHGNH
jgi:hypothetical protein